MFGLPLELITMLGSTVLGGVMSIWGQSMKMKQEQNKMLMERANANASFAAEARNAGKKINISHGQEDLLHYLQSLL